MYSVGVKISGALMRRLSVALITVVCATALPRIALAADLPVKAPVYRAVPLSATGDWSGFYAGAHFGYLFGHTRIEENETLTELGPTNGVIGGVLGGYNWQSGALVLGIDADIGWSNAHGTGEMTHEFSYDINWTAHVRGRLGYAVDHWLIFAAGGLAVADASVQQVTTTVEGGKYFGWSIGGGVDYAFTRNLIGRIEYLYDDFGHKDYSFDGDPYRVFLTGQTVRGALTWKFN
jgi:opacity protein-like surface antigen